MLVEVRVQSLGMDRITNHPVVVLKEVDGDRVLPIWIGPSEASAIATQLAGVPLSRPFTHDLLVEIVKLLGGAVHRAVITRVIDGTYFAELIVDRNGDTLSIDARPSDSIAIALRTDATILADDSLLEEREQEEVGELGEEAIGGDLSDSKVEMDPEELKAHLQKLDPEDFGRFNP